MKLYQTHFIEKLSPHKEEVTFIHLFTISLNKFLFNKLKKKV